MLAVDAIEADRTLYALQVTAGSTLGALAHNCGGLLIDHGWLRILGGGTDQLPSLASANGLGDPSAAPGPPPFLIVAFDVLGGRFAIDGGGLGVAPGEVCYWGPDTLEWESLGIGHTAFVNAFLQGAATEFYASWRWPGWEAELGSIGTDQGLSLMPPPFTAQGSNLAEVSRRPVPFAELLSFYDELANQVKNLRPGESFRLATD